MPSANFLEFHYGTNPKGMAYRLFLFLVLVLPSQVLAAEFACAALEPSARRVAQTPEHLSALVIFSQFQDEGAPATAPSWANDLFDAELPGSFAHFYREMSGGRIHVDGQVLPRRYRSRMAADTYLADTPGALGQFGRFNLEILTAADADVDLGHFDNDGPDGVPNSGDDDGYVDIVFINLHTAPRDFFVGAATGIASLGMDADYISGDPAASGGFVRVRSRFTGFSGTTQRGHTFSVTASTMCHEFAHILGLPDLFDQTALTVSELDPEEDSAGIGNWGIMGWGTLGWGVEDGPNAFSAWSLATLGWVEVIEVEGSVEGLEIGEIFSDRKAYKIPLTQDEYFLLEHRRAGGSYYNRNIPQDGLLIWHVDEQADNDEERHKQVDLVCADGLFADQGFPNGDPDAVEGRDNLDFWARDLAYSSAHNGNKGDATDPFDGVRFRRFAWDTNPAFSGHTGFVRNLPLGMAIENIRPHGAAMVVDVVRQQLVGHIVGDATWTGRVDLDGDVIVVPGATLTIDTDAEIRFARGDAQDTGFDPDRSELIVYGDLKIGEGASFKSSATRTGPLDWSGIYLLDGQGVDPAAIAIEHAHRGVVGFRLPPGRTQWLDEQAVYADLVVPAGSELHIGPSSVSFPRFDLSRRGVSPDFAELIVEGALTIEGMAGDRAQLTTDPGPDNDGLWYGIRVLPGAQVEVQHAELTRTAFAFSGEIDEATTLRIADSAVSESGGNGLLLRLNGQAQVDRTQFTFISGPAVFIAGSGQLVLRNVTIEGNGQEGILLNNASLEAIRVAVIDNGQLDPDDPRTGVRAIGGRGQRIEMWKSQIEQNTAHGMDLEEWLGEVELHDSRIVGNQGDGLRAGGAARLVLAQVLVERNLRAGAEIAGSLVEIWNSTFRAHVTAGLRLGLGTRGVIEMSSFVGGRGLELAGVEALEIRASEFVRGTPAIQSVDSAPHIVGNRFADNAVAIRVEGRRVPLRIHGNTFANNATAIENLSTEELNAQDNYWSGADSAAIAAQIEGAVAWTPFRTEEGVSKAVALPADFALHPAYPNPFNAEVALSFDLPKAAAVGLVLYDALGRPVRHLVDGPLAAGRYRFVWDGRDRGGQAVASGIYFYRLAADSFVAVGRLALVR